LIIFCWFAIGLFLCRLSHGMYGFAPCMLAGFFLSLGLLTGLAHAASRGWY
jgi:hypothetical protein